MKTYEPGADRLISLQGNAEDPAAVAASLGTLLEEMRSLMLDSVVFATVLGVAIAQAERGLAIKPVSGALLRLGGDMPQVPMLVGVLRGIELGLQPGPGDDGGARIAELVRKAA